jgi:hypothetical protein
MRRSVKEFGLVMLHELLECEEGLQKADKPVTTVTVLFIISILPAISRFHRVFRFYHHLNMWHQCGGGPNGDI